MSLTFTKTVDLIDNEVKTNNVSYPLADKVLDINLSLDDAIDIAIKECGTGQFDDTNHTRYPIITTDLNSGQRDVTYTEDGQGNLVLDIYKVFVKDRNGIKYEIPQVDVQSEAGTTEFTDGRNQTGSPTSYDRTGNGIIFNLIPDYTQSAGVEMWVNREGSYFTISDTTKKCGLDGRLHEYLVVGPAYKYATRNELPNEKSLEARKIALEAKIKSVYSRKDPGRRKVLASRSSRIPFR